MKKKYIVNGEVYEVPDAEAAAFLKDFPDAKVSYDIGGQKYEIPHQEVDAFETDMGLKKKEVTPLPSQSLATPTPSPSPVQKVKPLSELISAPEIPTWQQANQPSSTRVVQPKITATYDDFKAHNEERVAKKAKLKEQAVENAARRVLKNKGVIKPEEEGKALNLSQYQQLSKEKKRLQEALDTGDATFAISKDGEVGLKKTIGWWEALQKGWNSAMQSNDEAADFAEMDAAKKVEFLHKKEAEAPPPSEYIGERPGAAGSAGQLIGENAPFLGKAAAGTVVGTALTMAAPATGGISTAGIPLAMSFLFTAEDSKNAGIQQEVTRRFYQLKQERPEADEVELMKEAEKGALIGGLTGIATNAALMTSLKTPLSNVAKGVVGKSITKAVGNSVYGGAATAGLEGLKMAEGNLEGIKATPTEIAKDMGKVFSETATNLGLLHVMTGAVTGAVKLPKMVRSAIKYGLRETDPKVLNATLDANVEAGKITQGVADKVKAELAAYNAAADKVVDGLSPEAEASVAGLVEAKDKLIAEQKTKDDSQKAYYEEKIDGINQQIQKTINTGKPYAHEINEISGERYTEPTGGTSGTAIEPLPKNEPATEKQGTETTISESAEPISGDGSKAAVPILKPSKPISEMNSDELYEHAVETRKALNKQDKEFEGKTEKEKEDGGYYDVLDNVEDLRDAAERVNFVENSENINELANSVKSVLRNFDKNNPSETTLAVLNAAKKKAAELGIETNDLIKEVIKSVGKDYKDAADAEFMMRNAMEKISGGRTETTTTVLEGKGVTDEKLLNNPTPKSILENIDDYSNSQLRAILEQNDSNGDYKDATPRELKQHVIDLLSGDAFDAMSRQVKLKWLNIPKSEDAKVVAGGFAEKAQNDKIADIEKYSGMKVKEGTVFEDIEGNQYKITKVGENEISFESLEHNEDNFWDGEHTVSLSNQNISSIFYKGIESKSETKPSTVKSEALKDVDSTTKALTGKTVEIEVPLSDITATQSDILTEAIERVKQGKESKSEGSPEVEIRDNGLISIVGGNHRIAKAILNGDKTIKVKILNPSQAYHNSVKTGNRPQLIKAVEETVAPKSETKPSTVKSEEQLKREFDENDSPTQHIQTLKELPRFEGVSLEIGGSTVGTGPKGIKEKPNDIDVVYRIDTDTYVNQDHPFWEQADALAQQDGIDVIVVSPIEVSKLEGGNGKWINRLIPLDNNSKNTIKNSIPIDDVNRYELLKNKKSETKPTNETKAAEIPKPTEKESVADKGVVEDSKPTGETKKDLATKARELADKLDKGEASVLPNWLKAKTSPGTKLKGIDIDKAYANALRTFADIHDKTKDFAKALDEGFKHIKDWFRDNNIPIDEAEMKGFFEKEVNGQQAKKGNAEVISITHAETDAVAKELGLDEMYTEKPETKAEWDAEVDKRLAENPNAIAEMLEKFRNKGKIDKYDQRMMLKYHASLKARLNKNPTPELLQQYSEAKRLSDIEGGREVAKSLVARQGTAPVEDNLASYLQQEAAAHGVETLPQDVLNDLKAKFEADQKVIADLNARVEKLEEEAAKRALGKMSSGKTKTNKTSEDFKQERAEIRQSIRDKLRKARGETSVVVVPYAKELVAIAPDVLRMVKSYIDEGVVKLEEIVKRAHKELQEDMPDITERDVRDIIKGEYTERKQTRNEIAASMRELKTQQILIDKLEALQRGEKAIKDPIKKQRVNEEIKKLKEQIREFGPSEESKLQSLKTGLKNKIAKLKKDLETGDFLKEPEPKKPLKLDEEALRLKDEHIRFVKETNLRRAKAEYENRGKAEKVYDGIMQVLGLKRIVQTAIDLSIPFRQGVTLAFNPRRWETFGKGFNSMLKSVFSPKRFDRIMYDIHNAPNYKEMLEDKVSFNEMDAVDSNSRNEDFQKSFVYKIPYIREPLLASNRAADGFLNVSRYEMYMKGKKMLERQGITRENSPEHYEALGKWVMNMTGRGNMLKFIEDSHSGRVVASNTFFGARLMASRFNLLNPVYYAKMPRAMRVEAMKDMATYTAMITATLLAAKAAGATVSTDINDPDFLKIKVGNTKYDISGGMVQYIRTYLRLNRMMSNRLFKPDMSQKEKDKYAAYAIKSTTDFFKYKLAPNTSYALSGATGKDPLGQPFDPTDALKIYPMYVDDMIAAYKESGPVSLATIGIPSILGVGVQTYEDKQKMFDDRNLSAPMKTVAEKGVKLPESGTPKTHHIAVDDKHENEAEKGEPPYALMTDAEFKTFTQYRAEEIEKRVKEMLENKHTVIQKNEKGVLVSAKNVQGKDLEKEDMQSRVKAIGEEATNAALKKMNLKRPPSRNVEVKEWRRR